MAVETDVRVDECDVVDAATVERAFREDSACGGFAGPARGWVRIRTDQFEPRIRRHRSFGEREGVVGGSVVEHEHLEVGAPCLCPEIDQKCWEFFSFVPGRDADRDAFASVRPRRRESAHRGRIDDRERCGYPC